jgi:peptide-methionine (S)-S-oxide reductase
VFYQAQEERTMIRKMHGLTMGSLSGFVLAVMIAGPVSGQRGPAAKSPGRVETAVFAGGCFWGIEGVFDHIKGVRTAESGYAGGTVNAPSYEQVSTGRTGHAESVRVVYDPTQVTYAQLLQVFFSVAHDPTQLNMQGPDHGTQYRSAIFYMNDAQKRAAESYIAQLTRAKVFPRPIVTQVAPLKAFNRAEAYHQDYMEHNPDSGYIIYNDAPKVENLRKMFPQLYRTK